MKIRKDDIVKIIAGKDKGKTGKVLRVFKDKNVVLIEGVNVVKKHLKAGAQGNTNDKGGIVSMEKPVHVSNVMYFDEKENKAVKLGYKKEDGKKFRISKASGKFIDKR